MQKIALIVYNEALDMEVMEVIGKCGLNNYTKIPAVFGKGTTSGVHLDNDIWPGRNTILFTVCEEQQAKDILACVRELRKKLGKEGVKAFALPVEEVT